MASVARVPPVVRLPQPVASRPPIVRLPVTAVASRPRVTKFDFFWAASAVRCPQVARVPVTAVSRPLVNAATATAKLLSTSYVKPVTVQANRKQLPLFKSTELSHDQIYAGQNSLRKQFPHLAGLEDTGLGEYVPGVSLPEVQTSRGQEICANTEHG